MTPLLLAGTHRERFSGNTKGGPKAALRFPSGVAAQCVTVAGFGAAFLYARPDAQPLLEPLALSWDWSEASWAIRHRWAGTRDPSAHLAVPAAIDFQAEHDWDSVRRRCHELAVRATREIGRLLGTEPLAASEVCV